MKDLSKSQWLHLFSLGGFLIIVPIALLTIKLTENRDAEKLGAVLISACCIFAVLVLVSL